MWTPFMSSYEPESRADGSIDPLGLQSDAGRLADLMLPGFTVRVDRLRALTLSTAIVQLSRQLAPERQLPYRLCLERIVLDALVAQTGATTDAQVRGFPGRSKARSARARRQPLTIEHYIKGPATNGLVGAYATLAASSQLFGDGALLKRGDALLRAWENEVDQVGLVTGGSEMTGLRRKLDAVARRDLEKREFDPAPIRQTLYEIARLDKPGKRERAELSSALADDGARPQAYVLDRLRESLAEYREWVSSARSEEDGAERIGRGEFERRIMDRWQSLRGDHESDAIALVARTAVSYERASQLLSAAFDAMRWLAAEHAGHAIGVDDVLEDKRAHAILGSVLDQLSGVLVELEKRRQALVERTTGFPTWERKPAELGTSMTALIEWFQSARTTRELLDAIIERHKKVQMSKRKTTWMLADGSKYRFLGAYQLPAEAPARPAEGFPHAFRFVNALSILSDLEA